MAAIKISTKILSQRVKIPLIVLAIVLLFIAGIYCVYTFLPVHVDFVRNGPPQVGVDWKGAYRIACLELLAGRSPYLVRTFFNPPWVLLPLLPIALFHPAFGSAVMYVINISSYLFVIYKLKTKFVLIIIFILFSRMIGNSNNGNIEGILALGFVLPPQIGLFFVLAKPQMGAAVALFWLIESWREGGFRKTFKLFLPVVIAYMISFLIFGFWFMNSFRVINTWSNESIWPKGIPIGLFFFAMAIWKRELKLAIAASPFFAPYLVYYTWAVVLLGLFSLLPLNFRFSHPFQGFLSNLPLKNKELPDQTVSPVDNGDPLPRK